MAKRERAPNDSLPDPVGASPAHRETATAKVPTGSCDCEVPVHLTVLPI
jgi:hypothetical protein